MNIKELQNKMKNDPVLKQKVIRGIVFFSIFIIAVIALVVIQSSGKESPATLVETKNRIDGRMIPADTTSISNKKEDIFKNYRADSIVFEHASASNVLGGSMMEQQQQQQQTDNMLGDYMAQRQKSINRMQSSGSSNNYVSPTPTYSRRNYNPSGRSQDWTSEPTSVTGTRIADDQPIISAVSYNRNYNPENPQASISSNLSPEAVNFHNTETKLLTKEEKLQKAIEQKYGGTKSANGGYQGISVSGMIFQNQKIDANNTSVRILLSEKINLGDVTIGTDAFVFGMAQIGSGTIQINVPTISYKGKSYQVNLEVFDARTGERGIPTKGDNIVGNVQKQAETEASNELGRYAGRVGQIATSILGSRNRQQSITLNQGHRIFLKSK